MAPRRRPRKVGLKRMDAAIDALTPMGFPPELIRKKVKDLLEVYDGDEGWPFIEEASYKLLIESILEEQENCVLLLESSNAPGGQGSLLLEAGPSHSGPSCADGDAVLLSPETVLELPRLPPGEAQSSQTKNSALDNVCHVNPTLDAIVSQLELTAPIDVIWPSFLPGFEQPTSPQVSSVPRKRKPCFGWLGPADDDDFVLLKPARVRGQKERRMKHISRWDVMPDGVV